MAELLSIAHELLSLWHIYPIARKIPFSIKFQALCTTKFLIHLSNISHLVSVTRIDQNRQPEFEDLIQRL